MIYMKYPNGKNISLNINKNSNSNRGMSLESDIIKTNEYYLSINLANIHKKPTPIQIVRVDYPKRSAAKIIEAYFKLPSTTDFNGIYKKRYIDFEAKESNSLTSFPFTSIHKHQIEHIEKILSLGGISFVIIRFVKYDKTFLIDGFKFIKFYKTTKRKSIPYAWIEENGYIIPFNYLKPVDYLSIIDKILED